MMGRSSLLNDSGPIGELVTVTGARGEVPREQARYGFDTGDEGLLEVAAP